MPDKLNEPAPLNTALEVDGADEDDEDDAALLPDSATRRGVVSSLELGRRRGGRPGNTLTRTTDSPINADRPVFTLSVAADLLGMHPRTLRIYEEEGLVVPARTQTKRRRYSQNDIKRFQF